MKTHIVIHHSLTEDGDTVSWGAIRKYHVKTNGWASIAYQAGIEKVGDEYEVFLGRMPDAVGAHCKDHGMNMKGIGICCVGNYDLAAPPPEMMKKLIELCRYFMRTYKIEWRNVIGHREAQRMAGIPIQKRKTCPGTKFDMEGLRRALAQVA